MAKKIELSLPDNPEILTAAGKVALAHGHLEHILRMLIKTLSGLEIKEALDATERTGAYQLRERIKKLFKERTRSEIAKTKLDSLLGQAGKLSEERNKLFHRPWTKNIDGSHVTKNENHSWSPSPTAEELNQLASEIIQLVAEINSARLKGFIKEIMDNHNS